MLSGFILKEDFFIFLSLYYLNTIYENVLHKREKGLFILTYDSNATICVDRSITGLVNLSYFYKFLNNVE